MVQLLQRCGIGTPPSSLQCCADITGNSQEVTLCYDNLKELMESSPYYGCTVGRVANRIAKGSFELDGKVGDNIVLQRSLRESLKATTSYCVMILYDWL